MYSKIVNPKTGRKVSISGKIGRQVIARYIEQVGGVIRPDSIDEFCLGQRDNGHMVEYYTTAAANQEPPQELKDYNPILYNQLQKFGGCYERTLRHFQRCYENIYYGTQHRTFKTQQLSEVRQVRLQDRSFYLEYEGEGNRLFENLVFFVLSEREDNYNRTFVTVVAELFNTTLNKNL